MKSISTLLLLLLPFLSSGQLQQNASLHDSSLASSAELRRLIDIQESLGPSDAIIPLYEQLLALPIFDSIERVNDLVSYYDLRLKTPTSTSTERESILLRAKQVLPLSSGSEATLIAFLNAMAKEAFHQEDFAQGVDILISIESNFERANEYSAARVGSLLNLAGLYVDQNLSQLATPLLRRALVIMDSVTVPANYYPAAYYSLGRSFLLDGNCENALSAFDKSRSGFLSMFGSPSHPAILSVDSYSALCHNRCGNESIALGIQRGLIEGYQSFYPCPNIEFASFYGEISNSYYLAMDFDSAAVFKGLSLSCYGIDSVSLASLSSSKVPPSNLFSILAREIDHEDSAEELYRYINIGISLLDYFRNTSLSSKNLIDLNSFARPFIASSIRQIERLEGFDSRESRNAMLFLMDIVKSVGSITESVQYNSETLALKRQVKSLQDSLFMLSRGGILESSDLSELSFRIDTLMKEYSLSLSHEEPIPLDIRTLAKDYGYVNSAIPENTLLLNFFVNRSDVYCFALENSRNNFFHFSVSDSQYNSILDYVEEVTYLGEAGSLPLAVSFIDSLPVSSASSLLISSDSWLSCLPFDLVRYESDYLLRSHSIGYLPSVNEILSEQNESTSSSFLSSSIFNPLYLNSTTDVSFSRTFNPALKALPFAVSEAHFLDSILPNSSLFSGIFLSKDSFLTHLSKDEIIHLSSHAEYNYYFPEASSIYLSSDPTNVQYNIYLHELDRLQLDNEMIFLSGCDSGTGILHDGIGVMSMSQSLLRAGAKSVVSTSWPIDDQSTSLITKYFYDALLQGESKIEALRSAKLDYLEKHPELGVHPYFWASLRMEGNPSSLVFERSSSSVLLILSSIFVALVVFVLVKWVK